MMVFRTALTVLTAASIAQRALARTELASHPEMTSVAGESAPVDEQMCELQRYITLRHPPAPTRFDSAPGVLDPFRCRGR